MDALILDESHAVKTEMPPAGKNWERIEYGKFTNAAGVVDPPMEHRILAISDGFPTALKDLCSPGKLGPSSREQESGPDWADYGLVLQPVLTGETTEIVFCKVRYMPEGTTGRHYHRARFLRVPTGIGPLEMLTMMNRDRLGAFTESMAVDESKALKSEPPDFARPRLSPKDSTSATGDAFLNSAVRFMLSGTPVAIEGKIQETDFFDLAEAIWRSLPDAVKPYFSAGWNVAESRASELAFCAGIRGDDSCARFLPSGEDAFVGTWRTPTDWSRNEGTLADSYLKVVFDGDAANGPRNSDVLTYVEQLCSRREPMPNGPIRWSNPAVVSVFRSAGRAASDAWRLVRVQRLLNNDFTSLEPRNLRKSLWLKESLAICLELVTKALEQDEKERGAAWVLARWYEAEPHLIREIAHRVKGRITQFVTLCEKNSVTLLNDFTQEAGDRTSAKRPFELEAVAVSLRRGLLSLNRDAVMLHVRLLNAPQAPPAYEAFLAQAGLSLAIALDKFSFRDSANWLDPLARRDLSDALAIRQLEALAKNQKPQPGLVETLTTSFLEFATASLPDRIKARWIEFASFGTDARNALLEWAIQLVEPGALPIADLVRRYRKNDYTVLSSAELHRVCAEIVGQRVPASAEKDVAAASRRQLEGCLDSLLKHPTEWRPIARHWPRELGVLLRIEFQWPSGVPPEFASWGSKSIEKLLTQWADESPLVLQQRPAIAQNLLALAGIAGPDNINTAPVASLCERLRAQGLKYFENGCPHSDEQVERAAILIRAAQWKFNVGSVQAVWRTTQSDRALLLLLSLVPEEDFRPTEIQLLNLSKVREGLRACISRGYGHSRHSVFKLAMAGFHQYSYSPSDLPLPTTPLWAVYSGVPVSKQGSLEDALDHYGTSGRERIALCGKYLDAMEPTGDISAAAARVRAGFILPVVRHGVSGYSGLVNDFFKTIGIFMSGQNSALFRLSEMSSDDLVSYRIIRGSFYYEDIVHFYVDSVLLRLTERVSSILSRDRYARLW